MGNETLLSPDARKAIRMFCVEQEMTLEQLAMLCRINGGSLSRIIRGQRRATDEQVEAIRFRTGINLREYEQVAG